MKITINGDVQDLPAGSSVTDLLTRLALPATRAAVERNRQLVRRADHATTQLADGDIIEVVTLVGGG